MILDEILAAKRREIEAAKRRLAPDELMRRAGAYRAQRDFAGALRGAAGRPALIAELKRRSPSKGMLRERFDPVSLAQQLQEAGASALSVLTDEQFFSGCLDFLRDAHQFTEVPCLRKDFILEPYQIYEAAIYEADAVLLIVAALSDDTLRDCLQTATRLEMAALVEVHAEAELQRALTAGAQVIGINHRDLRTFQMYPDLTDRLVPQIPRDRLIVAESGIQTPQDLLRLRDLGVHAVLIGEALMTAPDVRAKVRELFTGVW
ncbi:MAG: indole-3-glycerol phosphate synthase TrpC [Candidatus Omnitrophica bacterium]|nr:indole-3-glycerol phosphate synthase TrpC [Candidatus Omnitrophota bacterium]